MVYKRVASIHEKQFPGFPYALQVLSSEQSVQECDATGLIVVQKSG
jgi:hypothetical protein